MTATSIKEGQIWREVDPRFYRFARVVHVLEEGRRSIAIRTVLETGAHHWEYSGSSRLSWVNRERFNGKRGGYELVEDVP